MTANMIDEAFDRPHRFDAWEQSQVFTAELRAAFKPLRQTQ